MAKRGWPRPEGLRPLRRDRDTHVEGEHAGLVGEQRIDVELADLRHVGGELRELDEDQRDGVDVAPRARSR